MRFMKTKYYKSLITRTLELRRKAQKITLNTKKMHLQKSKVKIMHIIFYNSDEIIHKKFILQDC